MFKGHHTNGIYYLYLRKSHTESLKRRNATDFALRRVGLKAQYGLVFAELCQGGLKGQGTLAFYKLLP